MATEQSACGRLNTNVTQVGNVGTGEDNLIVYTLPAAALHTDGMGIRITAWGVTGNTANTKTLKFYLGTTVLAEIALTVDIAGHWFLEAMVIRTGAATQDFYVKVLEYASGGSPALIEAFAMGNVGSSTETLSGALAVKCTGEATANDDIIQHGQFVELIT